MAKSKKQKLEEKLMDYDVKLDEFAEALKELLNFSNGKEVVSKEVVIENIEKENGLEIIRKNVNKLKESFEK